MNLLAHLHAADFLDPVAAAGNFTADFCRRPGSPAFQYGVEVHRKIDSFTDSHPAVLASRKFFPEDLRRFSPVLLDLTYDHCLSRTWEKWSPDETREAFIDSRFALMESEFDALPARAVETIERVKKARWLQRYDKTDGVLHGINRIIRFRPRFTKMLDGMEYIELEIEAITKAFESFYPDLLAHVAENAETR